MTEETIILRAVAEIKYEHPNSRGHIIRELTRHHPNLRGASSSEGSYSGQVTEFGESPPDTGWNAAIEAAAKACEAQIVKFARETLDDLNWDNSALNCAVAIRRLKR